MDRRLTARRSVFHTIQMTMPNGNRYPNLTRGRVPGGRRPNLLTCSQVGGPVDLLALKLRVAMVMVVGDLPCDQAVPQGGHAEMSDQGIDPLPVREGSVATIVAQRKQSHQDPAV